MVHQLHPGSLGQDAGRRGSIILKPVSGRWDRLHFKSISMSTTRQLALEASVRFTNRDKYDVKEMLKNAEAIEDWLNRDLPKLKFVNNNGGEPLSDDADPVIQSDMTKIIDRL